MITGLRLEDGRVERNIRINGCVTCHLEVSVIALRMDFRTRLISF